MATAKEAYPAFLNSLLQWLHNRRDRHPSMAALLQAPRIFEGARGYRHVAIFSERPDPRVHMAFRQNMVTGDRDSKVFALEMFLPSGMTAENLESGLARYIPVGQRDTYSHKDATVYFIQIPWGVSGEWDRLEQTGVRDCLFEFTFHALRFAAEALRALQRD